MWILTASGGVWKDTLQKRAYLFCKKFEFTFNTRNLSTPIQLTITESGFAGLGHCMFLTQS